MGKAIRDREVTVAEAAFITGHTVRSVHNEIDRDVVAVRNGRDGRFIDGADLLYLGAVRNVLRDLAPAFRRRLRASIQEASYLGLQTAQVDHLSVALSAIETDLDAKLGALTRLRTEQIETRPDILAGEPVLTGTRVPVRHVADLRRQGVTVAEVMDAFDLTADQVAAADLFDRVNPRQGRPPRPRVNPNRVPAP